MDDDSFDSADDFENNDEGDENSFGDQTIGGDDDIIEEKPVIEDPDVENERFLRYDWDTPEGMKYHIKEYNNSWDRQVEEASREGPVRKIQVERAAANLLHLDRLHFLPSPVGRGRAKLGVRG